MFCFSRRADEESAKRSELEKVKREMENQLEELKEDLEVEKNARTKAEKQRRELGEVMQTLSNYFNYLHVLWLYVVENNKERKGTSRL